MCSFCSYSTSLHTVYGWPVSPYTQKVLAYLRYKQIPHQCTAPSIFKLAGEIKRKVGRPIMPVVKTPDGTWWQDSSEIIDHFEQVYPDNPVIPTTPRQRIAANLLELHGDEWLCMPALHYRWGIPQNKQFALNEFSKYSWPWGPGFIGQRIGRVVANKLAGKMQSYLPRLGISGSIHQGIEKYTTELLDNLEVHFTHYDFLLGGKPCIGDFSLFGPLWSHLYRDPGTTCLFESRPNIRQWKDRLLEPNQNMSAPFLADDEVPKSLEPILTSIFREQFEYCRAVIRGVDDFVAQNPDAKRVSRVVGEGEFQVGAETGTRVLLAYVQWMAQRPITAWRQVANGDRQDVGEWLRKLGGEQFMETEVRNPLVRHNHQEQLLRE